MNRYRWWHRLRRHTITTIHPTDFSDPDIVRYTTVLERCSCGDSWKFFALGMYEQYYPAGTHERI